MDPQQRILLHAAQEALEDAGYVGDSSPSSQRATTGCFIGLATGDYTDNLRNDIDVFYSPGTLRAFHSGRISFFHGFSGPSIVTDTACSSSMVSLYQACRALQTGDCTTAIAGGINVISSPDVSIFPQINLRRPYLHMSDVSWAVTRPLPQSNWRLQAL